MLDYNDLNDDEKRVLRQALQVERVHQYYLEDNHILLMKPSEMFEYIFIDEITKYKEAIEYIKQIVKTEIKETHINKTVEQILLEQHDKVIKVSNRVYAYKEM